MTVQTLAKVSIPSIVIEFRVVYGPGDWCMWETERQAREFISKQPPRVRRRCQLYRVKSVIEQITL